MLLHVRVRKGTRPRIVRDHRYGDCYLLWAACSDWNTAVGDVCDKAKTEEINRYLADISCSGHSGRCNREETP